MVVLSEVKRRKRTWMGGMGARGRKGAVLFLKDGSDVGGHEEQDISVGVSASVWPAQSHSHWSHFGS